MKTLAAGQGVLCRDVVMRSMVKKSRKARENFISSGPGRSKPAMDFFKTPTKTAGRRTISGLARPMLWEELSASRKNKKCNVRMWEEPNREVSGPQAPVSRVPAPLVSLPARICALVILLPRLRVDGKPRVQRLWFPITLFLFSVFGCLHGFVFASGRITSLGWGMDFWQLPAAALAVLAVCWSVRFKLQYQLPGIVPVAAAFRASSATANFVKSREARR
jgi:hypothetical protein